MSNISILWLLISIAVLGIAWCIVKGGNDYGEDD